MRALAGVVLALLLSACAGVAPRADAPRNIIILFGDGAAPTQWEFGRYTSRVLRNRPFVTTDVVFRQGTLGLLTTASADSPVTDSAAAASAMATGHKARTGEISVSVEGKPLKTALELAKERGKRVGLVTTAAVHDASPAAFAAHAKSRRGSQAIVDQFLAFEPEVLLGGGRDYFLPKGTAGGKRSDGKDVTAAFAQKGYDVVATAAALRASKARRLLGLFADDDMNLEIDRDPKQEPSTAEMASAALGVLEGSPNGFVLFIENEGIDTSAHQNDAAAMMRDLWAFDDAVQVALEFQKRHPDTLIVITGDHETGGMSWTYAQKELEPASRHRFYPGAAHLEMLNRSTTSFASAVAVMGNKPTAEALDKIVATSFPAFRLDADLRTAILNRQMLERNTFYLPHAMFGRMVARQTGIYWGTSGHTTEPVAVGALGPGASRFRGYMDNTDFAKILMDLVR